MSTNYRVIPVFLPMLACPHRCIYCNQFVISGQQKLPDVQDVVSMIERNLATMPVKAHKRVAFFGGSFTCLPMSIQNRYLDVVQTYLKSRQIEGIQLSTRPDYIDDEILQNLKQKGVTLIELGAQSLDDDILRRCGRGHTVEDVRRASERIRSYDMELGLQMMIGLPGDTLETAMRTAEQIVAFRASCTRIYPTLVVEGTALADDYQSGNYTPLTLEESVEWCKELYRFFTAHHVTILRMGLHPTQDLRAGEHLLAGPFHVSFKELVLTALWRDRIAAQIAEEGRADVTVLVPPREMNYAVGYASANRKTFPSIKFEISNRNRQ